MNGMVYTICYFVTGWCNYIKPGQCLQFCFDIVSICCLNSNYLLWNTTNCLTKPTAIQTVKRQLICMEHWQTMDYKGRHHIQCLICYLISSEQHFLTKFMTANLLPWLFNIIFSIYVNVKILCSKAWIACSIFQVYFGLWELQRSSVGRGLRGGHGLRFVWFNAARISSVGCIAVLPLPLRSNRIKALRADSLHKVQTIDLK